MPEEQSSTPLELPLTQAQRRHRLVTLFLLVVIVVMIVIGLKHPFFDLRIHGPMTPAVRKALAAKGVMIMGYWTVCFLLALGMVVVAWLEFREIQRNLILARRDVWREIAARSGKPGQPPAK